MAVTDRLTQSHDVGHDVLQLEHPEVCAGASETSLHFVGNTNAARGPDCSKSCRQITHWQNDLPATAQRRFAEERRRPRVLSGRLGDQLRILLSRIRAAMRAAKDVWHCHFVDPSRTTASSWSIELVGTEIDHRAGVAMVSAVDDDHIFPVRARAREPQRQLVRLTAAVNQEHYAERIREEPTQTLAVFDQFLVQVTSVGVESGHLCRG